MHLRVYHSVRTKDGKDYELDPSSLRSLLTSFGHLEGISYLPVS